MKGVVVTTDFEVRVEDFADPLYKTVGAAVGGYIEIVHPFRLWHPFCMIVNEEGRLHGLPINPVGSLLYGTDMHREPIVGDIVIMKDGYRNGEPDIVGLDDTEDVDRIRVLASALAKALRKKGEST